MGEQLQRVPQMLAGGFERGMPVGVTAALERAASVRSTAPVDDAAPLGCRTRHEGAPRRATSVHTAAAIREQARGRHGGNLRAPGVRGQSQFAAAAAASEAASSTQNLLPFPSADSTPTRPPMRSTALRTIASPIPVPG